MKLQKLSYFAGVLVFAAFLSLGVSSCGDSAKPVKADTIKDVIDTTAQAVVDTTVAANTQATAEENTAVQKPTATPSKATPSKTTTVKEVVEPVVEQAPVTKTSKKSKTVTVTATTK